MLGSNDLANLEYSNKMRKGEFKNKKDTTNIEDVLEMCKKFITNNSKKSTALEEPEFVIEETNKLIDLFLNRLDLEVEGYTDESGLERLRKYIKDEIIYYQCITDLMEDKEVDEIRINSHKTIFYEKKGKSYLFDKTFRDREQLERVLGKLIGESDKLSIAHPFVNSRTPESYRINATNKSISPIGDFTAVIRKFKSVEEKLTAVDLIDFRTMSDNMGKFIQILPKAGFNILTVGATGSGKTVTNEIIIRSIPNDQRTVFIENPVELTPAKLDNQGRIVNDFVQLIATDKENPRVTDPTPNNLVENALRMTPVWIVLGEARSDEQFSVLLKAALTGHKVITTLHAEDPRDALSRYLTAYMTISPSIPMELALINICRAFKFIINVQKLSDGTRKIMNISEIMEPNGTKPVVNDIYKYIIEEVTEEQKIIGRHKRVGKLSEESIESFRKSAVPDAYYKMFTEEPSKDEEERYNGLY